MNAPLPHARLSTNGVDGTGHHADEAGYLKYLWQHVGYGHCRGSTAPSENLIKQRRRFVRLYPDLKAWFEAPLPERVGSRIKRATTAFAIAQARPYLYFLACSGRIRLDWPWIWAVNYHVVTDDLLPPGASAFIAGLAEDARVLGYSDSQRGGGSACARVRRIVKHFCLNRSDRMFASDNHNSPLSEDDLLAFENSLDAFGRHPDLLTFYPTLDAWKNAEREHCNDLFILRVLLYHRGMIPACPKHTSPGRR